MICRTLVTESLYVNTQILNIFGSLNEMMCDAIVQTIITLIHFAPYCFESALPILAYFLTSQQVNSQKNVFFAFFFVILDAFFFSIQSNKKKECLVFTRRIQKTYVRWHTKKKLTQKW